MKKQKQFFKSMLVMLLTFAVIIGSIPYTASAETDNNASENPYGGTDYFFDATGGNDSNNGTSEQTAWKNLTKANSITFEPGDRLLLKAGEVWENQQLWPKGSGEDGSPIVIDMYGDESLGKPYIAVNGNVSCPVTYSNGSYTKNSNLVGLTGAVVLRNQQYWEIHNLEISNDDDFNTNITSQTVVRDGISISINADLLSSSSDKIMNYFRISDCYIHDIDGPSSWQKIHYGGIVFQVFGANAYSSYDQGAYYFQDVRIENNNFYKTELHAIEFAFNWFGDSQAQYDESGKYHEGWEQLWVRTRDLYSRDVYIGHNYCESIGQGAIQLANTKNMVVEYNEVNGFLERYNAVSCGLYLWAGADSVMQYNEVYDGPYDEYDGTPWDLEYTNFNVTYQFNYSHDNKAGWMSYMGNSSNSIARYNLSVNDNGVLIKNMLSTNYAPTYFVNNVFIYNASEMDYFHDEVFKDTVYFYNNVFYNYSTSTQTPWYRRDGALNNAVFSNNVYYEASGSASNLQPQDNYAITADPQFAVDPVNYRRDLGVDNILQAAAVYQLQSTSPLIDAGHYVAACGEKDFFDNRLYYGNEIDIGIHERNVGTLVENPEEHPFEDDEEERINLALNKSIVANYTHPSANLEAARLVDGNTSTRWACCDPDDMSNGYPIEITIDFGEEVSFDEVYLDEYTDNGTNLRINNFELQRYNASTTEYITFKSVTGGMGHNRTLNDFGTITSSKLRLKITSQLSTEYYTPSMTEIQVYNNSSTQVPTVTPTPVPTATPTPIPAQKVNLSLNKTATANYTHPRGDLGAEKLVDGSTSTRWACCDPDDMTNGYPIDITIDFGMNVNFDEIYLDEYTDSGTNLRIDSFELAAYNEANQTWTTFKSVTGGMGHNLTLNDFGTVSGSKLRLRITDQLDSEYWTPTMTEIQVYGYEQCNPSLTLYSGTYDKSEENSIAIGINLDGDTVNEIAYYGSEGNKLRTLYSGEEYTLSGNTYTISNQFLQTLNTGTCSIKFSMNSGVTLVYVLTVTE